MYELYGRKVVFKPFQASGDGKSPATARADARKVALDMGAFASIGGPTQTAAYQDELARHQVLCIACGYATPDSAYQEDAPYAWGQLASPDQLLYGVFDFGTENLFGKPAQFAGDPAMRTQDRVFGIVHYEQDPPVFGELQREAVDEVRGAGLLGQDHPHLPARPQHPAQAGAGDHRPAQGATASRRWSSSATRSCRSTSPSRPPRRTTTPSGSSPAPCSPTPPRPARLYDQEQWAHAFGASSLPARTEPQLSEPWRLYSGGSARTRRPRRPCR